MATDFRELDRNDQGVLAAGVLAFIASFFPYYGASAKIGGVSASTSTTAWHSYATLALLLVLAATVAAAALVFSRDALPELPVSWGFLVFALSALGTLLLIIRSFTLDSGDVGTFSYGLRWGAYVLMILCVIQTVFAFLRLRTAGETMPWQQGTSSGLPPAA